VPNKALVDYITAKVSYLFEDVIVELNHSLKNVDIPLARIKQFFIKIKPHTERQTVFV
jgi:hypothetical protein